MLPKPVFVLQLYKIHYLFVFAYTIRKLNKFQEENVIS